MTMSKETTAGSRAVRAFTLIELLVSIAIMSALIAIVAPAVSRAREAGKRTVCATHLRETGAAALMYVQSEKSFPPLNNEPEDGHWQYNYLIWDGRDFDQNFGPMVQRNHIADIRILYCPSQESEYHMQNTFVNPWPPQQLLDSRAAFGRRPLVTGLDVTRLRAGQAIYADLFHTPAYVKSAHKTGVNTWFADGHVTFVPKFDRLVNNDMNLPTSLLDNPTMLALWEQFDVRQ